MAEDKPALDTRNSTFAANSGDGYELQMGRHSRHLAPLFVAFAGVGDVDKVLDVGCGTGNLAVELAKNPAIRGIEAFDFSPQYIAYAKQRGADARINFQVADACAIPFPDAGFDCALSMLVLAFVPEPHRAVREMVRVTKPGGTVAACMWDFHGGLVFSRMFWDTAVMLDEGALEQRSRIFARPATAPGAIARLLRDAGLAGVEERALTIGMQFQNFDDFWAPFEGRDSAFGVYVATLDADRKTRFKTALRGAYLAGGADGPRTYFATAWAAKGLR